jgi:hypothetical protein
MEAVVTRELAPARSEVALCALTAAVTATLVAALGPPGGDAAAHLYRTELVRDGVTIWDNLWFAGHYPLASYSLLYYVFAALIGNTLLVAGGAVVSASLFAALGRAEWGDAARWPARAFAVLAATPLYTGTYSYSLGIAAALGALRLLQIGRRWPALIACALTLGFAPLAFAFLCLALGAVALARRRVQVPVAAGLAVVAVLELAILLLFPSEGRYPFSSLSLAAALTAGGLGAALAWRSERAAALRWFFVLWGAVAIAGFLVQSPFGDNLTRLRTMILPLVLLAAALARFRPRWLAGGAVLFALGYNVAPDLSALPKRLDDTRTAKAAFWQPALRAVAGDVNHRVAVVPTFGHWEAFWVPQAGVALARGWYRQLDITANPELYRAPLEPATYRRWLDRTAVRYVLLPNARLGPMGASREAQLLRSGSSGLDVILRSRDWTVYEVPDPTPILEGGMLTRLDHDLVAGRVAAPGSYRLRIRWSPYWSATGAVCVERATDGTTILRATHGGLFRLRAALPGSARCSGV